MASSSSELETDVEKSIKMSINKHKKLTLSWWRPLSYRNQSTDGLVSI